LAPNFFGRPTVPLKRIDRGFERENALSGVIVNVTS